MLHFSRYSGNPVPTYVKLAEKVAPKHFNLWQALFNKTVEDTAQSKEAILDQTPASLKLD